MIDRHQYVYPGHPLTIATFILLKFRDNLDFAFAPSDHGWPNALSDTDVPGAGDAVHAGLDLVKKVRDGLLTPEEAVEYADKRWTDFRTNCGYEDRLEPGRLEAEKIRPDFLRLATGIRREAA